MSKKQIVLELDVSEAEVLSIVLTQISEERLKRMIERKGYEKDSDAMGNLLKAFRRLRGEVDENLLESCLDAMW